MSELVKVNDQVDNVNLNTNDLEKIFDKAKKPRVRLENWFQWGSGLAGNVINHPRLGNSFIRTSKVMVMDPNEKYAETLNTVYELGAKAQ